MNGSRGFVYVATGSGYLEEARLSAASLRRHHPDARICLITDRPADGSGLFDTVLQIADAQHRPIDKLSALRCPYDRAIFLDTDTLVYGDLSPVFDVLDRFDLAVLQDVNRGWNYELPGVPACFTEFNTGVVAFRKSDGLTAFFASWRRNCEELQRTHGLINDQPAFRLALYQSELRVAPLPSEFHFLANFPNALLWKVRLVHGRGDLERTTRDIDRELGGRAFIPNVGVVPAFRGRRHWFRTTLRVAGRMARLCVFPPSDSSAKSPRHWWLDEERAAQERNKPS